MHKKAAVSSDLTEPNFGKLTWKESCENLLNKITMLN